jgi:hypothetical protein
VPDGIVKYPHSHSRVRVRFRVRVRVRNSIWHLLLSSQQLLRKYVAKKQADTTCCEKA